MTNWRSTVSPTSRNRVGWHPQSHTTSIRSYIAQKGGPDLPERKREILYLVSVQDLTHHDGQETLTSTGPGVPPGGQDFIRKLDERPSAQDYRITAALIPSPSPARRNGRY